MSLLMWAWMSACPQRADGWSTCELVAVSMARLARESAILLRWYDASATRRSLLGGTIRSWPCGTYHWGGGLGRCCVHCDVGGAVRRLVAAPGVARRLPAASLCCIVIEALGFVEADSLGPAEGSNCWLGNIAAD
jgi:hypothetical protein